MSQTAEVRVTAPHDLVAYHLAGPAADKGVIGEIQQSGGTYVPEVMSVLAQLLEPGSVAFDIGANIGVFALVMGRLVGHGQVFAFEPAPESFDYLTGNLERNGARNVVAEPCAVYDTDGTVPFVFSAAAPSGSFVPPRPERSYDDNNGAGDPQRQFVKAVRLDGYAGARGLRRVDLIMVDAEGAEMAVLRGATTTLAVHRPALLVEVNPVALRRFGDTSFRELVAFLRQGRSLFSITPGGHPARIVSDEHIALLLRDKGVIDLLCLPWPRRLRGTAAAAAWARGFRDNAKLRRDAASPAPPANNFVVEPSFLLSLPVPELTGSAGHTVPVTVTVHNTSPYWLSSDFAYHPVHLSYRWLTDDGEPVAVPSHRGRFGTAVAPGGTAEAVAPVLMPSAPGRYLLAFTLLQESLAWFDDLDPSLRLSIPVTVTG